MVCAGDINFLSTALYLWAVLACAVLQLSVAEWFWYVQ